MLLSVYGLLMVAWFFFNCVQQNFEGIVLLVLMLSVWALNCNILTLACPHAVVDEGGGRVKESVWWACLCLQFMLSLAQPGHADDNNGLLLMQT